MALIRCTANIADVIRAYLISLKEKSFNILNVLYWFKGEGLQGFEEKERNQLRFWIL
jgi:hypothetical protein